MTYFKKKRYIIFGNVNNFKFDTPFLIYILNTFTKK
jgi:hypothetical protein